jgi:hypothetical protein
LGGSPVPKFGDEILAAVFSKDGSMSDDRGFISVIRGVLLKEDAGLSADGIATNSAGGARIDGIGVGSKGEPGGVARRERKRNALKSRMDRKLHTALTAEGHVEFDLLSDEGRWRFEEGRKDGAIDAEPTLPNAPDEIDPHPKKKKSKLLSKQSLRRGPDAEIALNPVLPTRFEAYEFRHARPTVKLDYLVKIGLGDKKFITFYRNALKDPSLCINNSTYRPVVARLLDELLDIILGDQVFYNRVRSQLLQRQEHEENQENESLDETARFAAWRAKSKYAADG